MNQKGFTLMELILIIVILGILAISALPRYLNLAAEAERVERDGIVGAVRSGIALHRAREIASSEDGTGSFPQSLDDLPADTQCNTKKICFSSVLPTGTGDPSWHKLSDTDYSFNDGTSVTTYKYDSATGTFSP